MLAVRPGPWVGGTVRGGPGGANPWRPRALVGGLAFCGSRLSNGSWLGPSVFADPAPDRPRVVSFKCRSARALDPLLVVGVCRGSRVHRQHHHECLGGERYAMAIKPLPRNGGVRETAFGRNGGQGKRTRFALVVELHSRPEAGNGSWQVFVKWTRLTACAVPDVVDIRPVAAGPPRGCGQGSAKCRAAGGCHLESRCTREFPRFRVSWTTSSATNCSRTISPCCCRN